jgi:dUTP pyrophosphatase
MKAGPLDLWVMRLPHAEDLPLPAFASEGAAGFDLCAALPEAAPLTLAPRARALVPTGFAIALPPGFEAQVRPRSGLAWRYGVTILNAPGTIDSDYRGEILVLLVNHSAEPFTCTRGMRIAQLVIASVVSARLKPVDHLPETSRGAGGFGSTGV